MLLSILAQAWDASGDGWGEAQAAYHGLEQGCSLEQSRKGAERRGAQRTGIPGCTVEILPKNYNLLRDRVAQVSEADQC